MSATDMRWLAVTGFAAKGFTGLPEEGALMGVQIGGFVALQRKNL